MRLGDVPMAFRVNERLGLPLLTPNACTAAFTMCNKKMSITDWLFDEVLHNGMQLLAA
jgi:hypothetical protein